MDGGATGAVVTDCEAPDERLSWPVNGPAEEAQCSIWWQVVPSLPGHQVGVVGDFAALSGRAACEVLRQACEVLHGHDCTIAVGPMNGSTWRRYRLVTERGTEPPFFLEPTNPETWPAYFLDAGFRPLARYRSFCFDLPTRTMHYTAASRRLAQIGISIRPLNLQALEEELHTLHALAHEAFARNLLFMPIPFDEFCAIYRPLSTLIDPRLVLLAFDGAEPAGFAFGIPDRNEPARETGPRTVILKTLAARRGRRLAGLGGVLAEQLHERAAGLGYGRCIHALVHEGAASANLSPKYGPAMRRYTLFARPV